MRNKLVVVEGIDGVGKSTLCRSLKRELARRNIPAVWYEEYEAKRKGFGPIKPFVKRVVARESIDASLLFYLSSMLYKTACIKKLLRKSWVICDRYIYSTLAYHYARGASAHLIAHAKRIPFLHPDHAFLLTVPEKTRLARARMRTGVTTADLQLKRRGTHSYRMEQALKRFGLQVIDNGGAWDDTLGNVIGHIWR